MTREEMIAALKAEHGIDVEAMQAQVDATAALSNKIQEELVGTGLLTLSNTDEKLDADTLVGAIAEAGTKIVELSSKVDTLVSKAAEVDATNTVDELIRTGYILSKNRESMVELKLSNPDLFTKLIPEAPIVKLSHEVGVETTDETPAETVAAEIARLSSIATAQTSAPTRS